MVAPSPYRTAIIDCVKSGMTNSEIVKKLKVSRVLIFRTAQRYRHLGTSDDMQKRGRPATVTTPEAVKAVREKIRRTPERSVRKMAKKYEMSQGLMRTIVKDKLKMIPYRMQKGAFLNQKNKTLRMKKARKLLAGTQDGSHLTTLFTDEKIFTVEPNKYGQNHRIIATDYQSACEKGKILNKTSHPASVMVFAGITADGKTPLIFVDPGVKVNQVYYREKILKLRVLPWANFHYGNRPWTFQQDGAPAHRAKVTQEWYRANFPRSSRLLIGLLPRPTSTRWTIPIKALKTALIKKWDEIDDDYPRAVNDAYPKRLKAVEEALLTAQQEREQRFAMKKELELARNAEHINSLNDMLMGLERLEEGQMPPQPAPGSNDLFSELQGSSDVKVRELEAAKEGLEEELKSRERVLIEFRQRPDEHVGD
ncbi:unnamed protein product [Caenorhabditis auriculariae]|uniref:Tc1-like transposase DDE domain-containing protein n=1 Tax=Caenorhabditis auriculariae TaxID=2777116 RepID=A0A8S1HPS2_9PELO|nr:unnamed protein product [Caenorhabditis auriculariae]